MKLFFMGKVYRNPPFFKTEGVGKIPRSSTLFLLFSAFMEIVQKREEWNRNIIECTQ